MKISKQQAQDNYEVVASEAQNTSCIPLLVRVQDKWTASLFSHSLIKKSSWEGRATLFIRSFVPLVSSSRSATQKTLLVSSELFKSFSKEKKASQGFQAAHIAVYEQWVRQQHSGTGDIDQVKTPAIEYLNAIRDSQRGKEIASQSELKRRTLADRKTSPHAERVNAKIMADFFDPNTVDGIPESVFSAEFNTYFSHMMNSYGFRKTDQLKTALDSLSSEERTLRNLESEFRPAASETKEAHAARLIDSLREKARCFHAELIRLAPGAGVKCLPLKICSHRKAKYQRMAGRLLAQMPEGSKVKIAEMLQQSTTLPDEIKKELPKSSKELEVFITDQGRFKALIKAIIRMHVTLPLLSKGRGVLDSSLRRDRAISSEAPGSNGQDPLEGLEPEVRDVFELIVRGTKGEGIHGHRISDKVLGGFNRAIDTLLDHPIESAQSEAALKELHTLMSQGIEGWSAGVADKAGDAIVMGIQSAMNSMIIQQAKQFADDPKVEDLLHEFSGATESDQEVACEFYRTDDGSFEARIYTFGEALRRHQAVKINGVEYRCNPLIIRNIDPRLLTQSKIRQLLNMRFQAHWDESTEFHIDQFYKLMSELGSISKPVASDTFSVEGDHGASSFWTFSQLMIQAHHNPGERAEIPLVLFKMKHQALIDYYHQLSEEEKQERAVELQSYIRLVLREAIALYDRGKLKDSAGNPDTLLLEELYYTFDSLGPAKPRTDLSPAEDKASGQSLSIPGLESPKRQTEAPQTHLGENIMGILVGLTSLDQSDAEVLKEVVDALFGEEASHLFEMGIHARYSSTEEEGIDFGKMSAEILGDFPEYASMPDFLRLRGHQNQTLPPNPRAPHARTRFSLLRAVLGVYGTVFSSLCMNLAFPTCDEIISTLRQSIREQSEVPPMNLPSHNALWMNEALSGIQHQVAGYVPPALHEVWRYAGPTLNKTIGYAGGVSTRTVQAIYNLLDGIYNSTIRKLFRALAKMILLFSIRLIAGASMSHKESKLISQYLKPLTQLVARQKIDQFSFSIPHEVAIRPDAEGFVALSECDHTLLGLSRCCPLTEVRVKQDKGVKSLNLKSYNLNFRQEVKEGVARLSSEEYPGYFLSKDQFNRVAAKFSAAVVLENDRGEKLVISLSKINLIAYIFPSLSHLLNSPFIASLEQIFEIINLFPLPFDLQSVLGEQALRPTYTYKLESDGKLVGKDLESDVYLTTLSLLRQDITTTKEMIARVERGCDLAPMSERSIRLLESIPALTFHSKDEDIRALRLRMFSLAKRSTAQFSPISKGKSDRFTQVVDHFSARAISTMLLQSDYKYFVEQGRVGGISAPISELDEVFLIHGLLESTHRLIEEVGHLGLAHIQGRGKLANATPLERLTALEKAVPRQKNGAPEPLSKHLDFSLELPESIPLPESLREIVDQHPDKRDRVYDLSNKALKSASQALPKFTLAAVETCLETLCIPGDKVALRMAELKMRYGSAAKGSSSESLELKAGLSAYKAVSKKEEKLRKHCLSLCDSIQSLQSGVRVISEGFRRTRAIKRPLEQTSKKPGGFFPIFRGNRPLPSKNFEGAKEGGLLSDLAEAGVEAYRFFRPDLARALFKKGHAFFDEGMKRDSTGHIPYVSLNYDQFNAEDFMRKFWVYWDIAKKGTLHEKRDLFKLIEEAHFEGNAEARMLLHLLYLVAKEPGIFYPNPPQSMEAMEETLSKALDLQAGYEFTKPALLCEIARKSASCALCPSLGEALSAEELAPKFRGSKVFQETEALRASVKKRASETSGLLRDYQNKLILPGEALSLQRPGELYGNKPRSLEVLNAQFEHVKRLYSKHTSQVESRVLSNEFLHSTDNESKALRKVFAEHATPESRSSFTDISELLLFESDLALSAVHMERLCCSYKESIATLLQTFEAQEVEGVALVQRMKGSVAVRPKLVAFEKLVEYHKRGEGYPAVMALTAENEEALNTLLSLYLINKRHVVHLKELQKQAQKMKTMSWSLNPADLRARNEALERMYSSSWGEEAIEGDQAASDRLQQAVMHYEVEHHLTLSKKMMAHLIRFERLPGVGTDLAIANIGSVAKGKKVSAQYGPINISISGQAVWEDSVLFSPAAACLQARLNTPALFRTQRLKLETAIDNGTPLHIHPAGLQRLAIKFQMLASRPRGETSLPSDVRESLIEIQKIFKLLTKEGLTVDLGDLEADSSESLEKGGTSCTLREVAAMLDSPCAYDGIDPSRSWESSSFSEELKELRECIKGIHLSKSEELKEKVLSSLKASGAQSVVDLRETGERVTPEELLARSGSDSVVYFDKNVPMILRRGASNPERFDIHNTKMEHSLFHFTASDLKKFGHPPSCSFVQIISDEKTSMNEILKVTSGKNSPSEIKVHHLGRPAAALAAVSSSRGRNTDNLSSIEWFYRAFRAENLRRNTPTLSQEALRIAGAMNSELWKAMLHAQNVEAMIEPARLIGESNQSQRKLLSKPRVKPSLLKEAQARSLGMTCSSLAKTIPGFTPLSQDSKKRTYQRLRQIVIDFSTAGAPC